MSDHAFPSPAPAPRRKAGLVLWLLALVVLGAVGFALQQGWQKLEATSGTLKAENALVTRMGQQLQELQAQNAALAERIQSAEAGNRQLGEQLGTLGSVQQSQGGTLSQLDATLNGSRARFQLAAVEELLQLAADRIALHRDRSTAIAALELADTRLAALADSRLLPVREALASERLALLAVPLPDVAGAALTLGGLIARAPELPLSVRPPSRFNPPPTIEPEVLASDAGWPSRLWAGLKQALNAVVRVKREARPVDALLPPEQEVLIHHLLLSRLEAARLALLRSDAAATRDALTAASDCLARYYRADDPGVASARTELERLAALPASTALPVPMKALEALRLRLRSTP